MTDTPLIYDLHTDEYRPITQTEVDELCRIKAAYGNLRMMSQSVLSESHKIAMGIPHKDAPRNLDAYMAGEDLRHEIEKEQRIDAMIDRLDSDDPLEDILDDAEAKRTERPFPSYGTQHQTYAQTVEQELVHRTATRFATDGTYLEDISK